MRSTALKLSDNAKQVFWSRVDRRSPDECWPWTGAHHEKGYGQFCREGQKLRANRAALELHTGLPLGELLACHSCDNPPCCNPAHLFAGTVSDNTRDALNKGRLLTAFKLGQKHSYKPRPSIAVRGPRCGHSPDFVRAYAGGLRCSICRNAQQRAAYSRRAARLNPQSPEA